MTRIIYNDIIPFKGFKAITVLPFVFARNKRDGQKLTDVDINHERIHIEQQKEVLLVGILFGTLTALLTMSWWSLLWLPLYFWWYITEWMIRLFMKGNAYRNISFEQEAYGNEQDIRYLDNRQPFAWTHLVGK